jgi:hypothetical protein
MQIKVDVEVNLEEELETIALTSVIDAVGEVFHVPKREIMSKARPAYLAQTRFAIYYLAWLFTNRSLPSIGRFMGRDHTTVLHGRNRAIELMRTNPEYNARIEAAKNLAFQVENKRLEDVRKLTDELKKEIIQTAIEAGASSMEKKSLASRIQADATGGNTERQPSVEGV